MPYIKPEAMIGFQALIMKWEQNNEGRPSDIVDEIPYIMGICPVCGDRSCDKDVVKCNSVFVHPEDAEEAEPIERGELP